MGVAHEYAEAVLHRTRSPMEGDLRKPDWGDQPRTGKYYPTAADFPLPRYRAVPEATTQRGLFGPRGTGAFSLPLLSGMLQDSHGLLSRRLAVHGNANLETLPWYDRAHWARGTASGGGLYPATVYWAGGASGPMTPGVYHYDVQQHAMRRLLTGDVSGELRAAVGDDELTGGTDQFLILGVKFWLNTFKYAGFGYHVVTMDVGALLQSWRMWAGAQGLHLGEALWFDEPRLGRLLGLGPDEEGVFAVVPLRWAGDGGGTLRAAESGESGELIEALRVRITDQEQSRSTLGFDTVRRMHAATLVDAARHPARPDLAPPVPAGGERTPLPVPSALTLPIRAALRARCSSFGRYSGQHPMELEQLAAMLAAAQSAGGTVTRLYVFVNHVVGVPPGSYLLDGRVAEGSGNLRLVKAGAPGSFLQRSYTMHNYNLEQTGAVIVPAVRVPALLDEVGGRGYRLANAAVGATAQAVYTAAAAAGLGCGAALAFDGAAYTQELGLADTGELPLLIIAVGQERPDAADYRYEVV